MLSLQKEQCVSIKLNSYGYGPEGNSVRDLILTATVPGYEAYWLKAQSA